MSHPEISLFLAVDPECDDKDLFLTYRKEEYSSPYSKFKDSSKLGLIFPIKLELLPKDIKADYLEMVSPNPLGLTRLVRDGLSLIKEGGEFRIYLPSQDLDLKLLFYNKPVYLKNSNPSDKIKTRIKEHYRRIFELKENDRLEIEIISQKEASRQRDSVHFHEIFYENEPVSALELGFVVVISIKKGILNINKDD